MVPRSAIDLLPGEFILFHKRHQGSSEPGIFPNLAKLLAGYVRLICWLDDNPLLSVVESPLLAVDAKLVVAGAFDLKASLAVNKTGPGYD